MSSSVRQFRLGLGLATFVLATASVAGCKVRDSTGFLPPGKDASQDAAPDDGAVADAKQADTGANMAGGFGTINGGVNGVMFGTIVDTYFGASVVDGSSAIAIVQLSEQTGGCSRAGQVVGTDWRALQVTVVNNGGTTIAPGSFTVVGASTPVGERPTAYATVRILERQLGGSTTGTDATGGSVQLSMVGLGATKRFAGTFAATFEQGNHSGSFDTMQYCGNLEVE